MLDGHLIVLRNTSIHNVSTAVQDQKLCLDSGDPS